MIKRDDEFLRQIIEHIANIGVHLKKVTREKFDKSMLHRAAVVREITVIGEATKKLSEETKSRFKEIPWNEIAGMRNRLVHEYFDVDYDIVWNVATKDLPSLESKIEKVFLQTASPIHPWRLCPAGYYHVLQHPRSVPKGTTLVREHCRKNPSGKDQLYPGEISKITSSHRVEFANVAMGKLKDPHANGFDDLILLWTKYWNDLLAGTSEKLDPDLVKALMRSESSFNENVKPQRISKGNFARGLMQVSDQTRKALADEKGEIKEHYLTVTANEISKPDIAIASGIRWLFHKRETASRFLKRRATWIEAVAEYKGYLRRKTDWRNQKGTKNIIDTLEKLKEQK